MQHRQLRLVRPPVAVRPRAVRRRSGRRDYGVFTFTGALSVSLMSDRAAIGHNIPSGRDQIGLWSWVRSRSL
ncbi:hypothetical protein Pd630_LPD01796 [Rhodococcus opacus PD630]|nr:hypothetical protein Pd630_LPD01796 [Rhodococcus opacus PD630]